MASQTLCDWCEQEVEPADPAIRLRNGGGMFGPPLSVPYVHVTFHRECWAQLADLLTGPKVRPARQVVDGFLGRFHIRVTRR